ncbi:hypothetical protein D1AOALGA4SA_12458 [Olavius algarvensis Delta 1 endosymbiont]|nr:hypothetical protein D1AOALGA4SA_12458 [Olavius algarvensis Delta 1 endosymbiont]
MDYDQISDFGMRILDLRYSACRESFVERSILILTERSLRLVEVLAPMPRRAIPLRRRINRHSTFVIS